MINNVSGFRIIGYPIDKSMLPKRDGVPCEEKNFSPNDRNHFIMMNKDANKAELQRVSNLLSQ